MNVLVSILSGIEINIDNEKSYYKSVKFEDYWLKMENVYREQRFLGFSVLAIRIIKTKTIIE